MTAISRKGNTMKLSEIKPNFDLNATKVDLRGCTGLTEVPAFPNATTVDLCGCTGLTKIFGRPVNSAKQAKPFLKELAVHALKPDALDMGVVHSDCGTAHCMAGWANILWPDEVPEGLELPSAIAKLGHEAASYFFKGDDEAREFLEQFVGETP